MCRSVMTNLARCPALQVLDHLVEVREALGIDGEGPVLLVVDVELDDVGGNVLARSRLAIRRTRLGVVAVARLLEAERPQRRQRRLAGEPGVALRRRPLGSGPSMNSSRAGRRRSRRRRRRAPPCRSRTTSATCCRGTRRRRALAQRDEERDRLVERVGGLLPAVGVGVPVREGQSRRSSGPALSPSP